MSKIDLDPITSGYNLSKINANFQKVEDELNNKVLYRDSPAGEPNSMSSNLDMNSKSILNANKISSNILELGGVQVVPTNLAVDPYNGTREALRRSYAEAGYSLVDGSFEAGGTVTTATDVLLYEADGKAYSYSGTLSHTVAAGSNPSAEPGMWDDKSTEALRLQSQKEIGDPRGWGGVGDGIADDTLAVSSALQTGKLSLGGKTWKITSQITKTGKVTITGPGTIISPTIAIKVTDGSGSVVDNVTFMPDKVPYTIRRDHGTWAMVGTWEQRYDGYIPTPQDVDIWASVPTTVRNYNTGIGTGILFTVSSAAGGSNVKVSRISGSQVNIVIEGYTDSIVDKCSCGVGQLTIGGIFFHNGVVRAYNQALLGFRLPRGTGNKVTDCSVKYASLCGIVFGGNDKFVVSGNTSTDHAESAYKTLQYDNVEGISEDTAVMCTTGNYTGNFAGYCYYDGFDLQSIYGAGFTFVFGGHTIHGNISERNRLTGFHTNSAYNNIANNIANVCGDTGINVIGTGNTVHGNKIMDCALAPSNPQAFQLAVQGDDCHSYGNSIKKLTAYSTYDYIHTGLLGAAPTPSHEGMDFGNYCEEGPARIFLSDTIKAQRNIFFADIKTTKLTASKPITVIGNYTVSDTDYSLSFFTSSGAVVTLPVASTYPGRVLEIRNTSAFGILSESNNVGQITGGAPTNAILPAVNGAWCKMQSNGSEWIIMARGQ